MISAASKKIDYLYHYQTYNPEYLRQTIVDNLIYMGSPKGFNDPCDCRPIFNTDFSSNALSEATIEQYIKWHINQNPGKTISYDAARYSLQNDPNLLRQLIDKTSQGLPDDIDNLYRIYCLTTKPNNALMWAHYTNKHSGICLEYKVRHTSMSTSYPITYSPDYPTYNLLEATLEQELSILLTKSIDWSYEDEYRFIALNADMQTKFKHLKNVEYAKDNLYAIPNGIITSVIIGYKAPTETIQEIKDIIDHSQKPIRIKYATRSRSHYDFIISDDHQPFAI